MPPLRFLRNHRKTRRPQPPNWSSSTPGSSPSIPATSRRRVRDQERPFSRRRIQCRRPQSDPPGYAGLGRQGRHHRPRLHRTPQSRPRHCPALRSPGRQSLRGRVRHHRQHHPTSCVPAPRKTPPGTWVDGYFFDDTKVKDRRAAHHPGPRSGLDRAPRGRSSSRRPHFLLQQQGPGNGGHQPRNAEPAGGTFDKDSNGELNGRVTDNATGVFNRVGKRRPCMPVTGAMQRDRDGLAFISKSSCDMA